MIEERWLLFLVGWALVAVLQGALYLRQRSTRNATLVDAGWAFSLALLAVLYAFLAPGGLEHRLLIGVLASVESIRIGWLVIRRLGKDEDARYAELRQRWRARGREQSSFAVFFQAQALVAAVLSIPLLLACFNDHDGLEPLEWVGAAIWVVAFGGEWLADRQLAAFRGGYRQPRRDAAQRSLAVFEAPELLLPVADLGRICADRAAGRIRLARPGRPGRHAALDSLRHRDPAVRGAGAP